MRDGLHVQGPDEVVGIFIGANENREIPPAALSRLDRLLNGASHEIALGREGVEVVVPDGRPASPAGYDVFVHPLADLQPVGVVVADEAVGAVEDGLY